MNFVMRRRGYALARKICKGGKGMADIELVIKIPNETYQDVVKNGFIYDEDGEVISHAIINGTPLPKGHGRLIDANELYGDFVDGTEGYDCQTWNRIEIGDVIEDAPTIIEADTESEEV